MGRFPTLPGAALCLIVAAVAPSMVAVAVSDTEKAQEAAAAGRALPSDGPNHQRRAGHEPATGASASPLSAQAAPTETPYLGLLDEGLSLLRAGDYEAALKKFNAAGGLEPGPRIDYFKGLTLNRLGRHRQALVNLWLVEKAGETNTDLDLEIGRAAAGLGAWRLAVDRLDRFDRARPGDAQVSVYLGRAYLGLGDYDKAASRLREAMDRDPSARRAALYYLALLEQAREDPEAAQRSLWELEREAPDSPRARTLKQTLPEPQSPWQVSASLTYGLNDNVLSNPEGQALPEDVTQTSSDFWSYSGGVSYDWRITPDDILSSGIFVQGTRYREIRTADYASPSLSLGYTRRLSSDLAASSSVAYGVTRVDGRDFSATITTDLSLSHRPTDWLTLVAGYGFSRTDYDIDPAIEARDRDGRSNTVSLTGDIVLPEVVGVRTRLRLGLSNRWNGADGRDYDFRSATASAGLTFDQPPLCGPV